MIRLDSTLRTLQVVLAGVVTSAQLPFVASWSDGSSSSYSGGVTPGVTNNTTPVTIVGAPGSGLIRDVDYLSLRNKDTVTATATVLFNDNGTTYELIKVVMAVGDQLIYTHAHGWYVVDNYGSTRTGLTGQAGQAGTPGLNGPAIFLEADFQEAEFFPIQGNRGITGSTGATGSQGPATFLEAEMLEPEILIVPGPPGPTGATGAQGPISASGMMEIVDYIDESPIWMIADRSNINLPVFSARRVTSNQSLTTAAYNKIQLNSKDFDTANAFDAVTNFRFQPNIAGYYQISAAVDLNASGITLTSAFAALYKNGANAVIGNGIYGGTTTVSEFSCTLSALIFLNGTSDYIELFAYIQGTTPSANINSFMTGFLVRPA